LEENTLKNASFHSSIQTERILSLIFLFKQRINLPQILRDPISRPSANEKNNSNPGFDPFIFVGLIFSRSHFPLSDSTLENFAPPLFPSAEFPLCPQIIHRKKSEKPLD